MNCEDARLLIGADPDAGTPELEHHLDGCSACRQFREEMSRIERGLRRALESDPPAVSAAPARIARRHPPPARTRTWALAASVLLVLAAVAIVWSLRPPRTLASEVMHHVDGEPRSWAASTPVDPHEVAHILAKAGVEITDPKEVVYARTCRFRGHDVPHLVVQVAHRPYTVLILRHEALGTRQRFEEGGYTGMLVPAGSGSIAILGLGAADVDSVSRQVLGELRFHP